jgi:hypothetical protein
MTKRKTATKQKPWVRTEELAKFFNFILAMDAINQEEDKRTTVKDAAEMYQYMNPIVAKVVFGGEGKPYLADQFAAIYLDHPNGVGVTVAEVVYEGREPVEIIECGCCGSFHRNDYFGECRDDSERFVSLEMAEARLMSPVEEVFNDDDEDTDEEDD